MSAFSLMFLYLRAMFKKLCFCGSRFSIPSIIFIHGIYELEKSSFLISLNIFSLSCSPFYTFGIPHYFMLNALIPWFMFSAHFLSPHLYLSMWTSGEHPFISPSSSIIFAVVSDLLFNPFFHSVFTSIRPFLFLKNLICYFAKLYIWLYNVLLLYHVFNCF